MNLINNQFINKSIFLGIIIISIGLPILNILSFSFLLISIPIIYFSTLKFSNKNLIFSIIFLFIYLFLNSFIPKIKIQEGHNIILLSDNSKEYYLNNLPNEIFNFLDDSFKSIYSYSSCEGKIGRCWRNYTPKSNENIFLKSDDWSHEKILYSRITNNIYVDNLTSARIGKSNSPNYNFYKYENEKDEIERDYMPFFIMYKIPQILLNSSICWSGNTFWEDKNNNFIHKKNLQYECKKISSNNINKKIYGINLGNKENFKIKLKKNFKLHLINSFDIILTISFILCIYLLNFQLNYKVCFYSFLYFISYLLLLFYQNKALIFGFDIFPGGMDGIVHISFGSRIFEDINNFEFSSAFRGGESAYYFLPGLRYFWALNKFIFGDTFYGYLLLPFLYSFIIYLIFSSFIAKKTAIILTSVNFFSNIFEGYALPNIKMLSHINVGHAEPFSIFFMLLSISIFINSFYSQNKNLSLQSFFLGFSVFLSVFMRPDYLPSALILIISFIYIQKKHINFKKIILFCSLGFSFILISPLHNYVYSNQLVLFTSNHPIIDFKGSG